MRRGGKTYSTAAENIAKVHHFYDVLDGGWLIDDVWQGYEQRLAEALEALKDRRQPMNAELWLRTLVPFVAALLVRGPDFGRRFLSRPAVSHLRDVSDNAKGSNVNMARAFELQRLLAPITSADWHVLHAQGNEPIVVNDLGYCLYSIGVGGRWGLAIPLDATTVLGVVPNRGTVVAQGIWPSSWTAQVKHVDLEKDNHNSLNERLAHSSQEFIASASADTIKRLGTLMAHPPSPPDPYAVDLGSPRLLVAHEFEWHRLAAALRLSPGDTRLGRFELDFARVSEGFCPPVILPTNLPEFPSGLKWTRPNIMLTLEEVAGFTVPPFNRGFGPPPDYSPSHEKKRITAMLRSLGTTVR